MTLPEPPLALLHLEDNELDHDLTLAQLLHGGLRVDALRVDTETAFRAALARGGWDLVLSDFNLPGFDGLQALRWLRDSGSDLPFILISGEIGEDAAVEAMRSGASDYLLKQNMARLVPAVRNAIAAARERRARRDADEQLAASRQRLSQLAQHLQTRVEAERAAIAREIHDDVGGSLTALKFDLSWIARQADAPVAIRARAGSALETLNGALEASQRIMHNLRPAILEQGLVPALQWLAGRFEKRSGIACRLRVPPQVPDLPSGVPLVAFRFAQEALTNVSKHAQASRVDIDLSLAAGVLSLEVSDDGRGLSDADLAKSGSFGLRGLQERAGTVGGWVDVSSHEGRGTVLLLSVPLQDGSTPPAEGDEDSHHDPSAWGDL